MRGYPKVGDLVRVKHSGEIIKVKRLWKPGRVMLADDRIMYLRGIEEVKS